MQKFKKHAAHVSLCSVWLDPAQDNLKAMQQKFVNEKFGMFIHFNMPLICGRRLARPPTCRPKPSTRRNWTVTNGPKQPLVRE